MTDNLSEFNSCVIQIEKMSAETLEMFKAKRSDVIPKSHRIVLHNHQSPESSKFNNYHLLKKNLTRNNEIPKPQSSSKPLKEKRGIIQNLKMIF